MKTCPHCAEQVQDAATKCPHCRETIFSTKPGTNAVVTLVVFVVMFFVLFKGITMYSENEAAKMMTKINADTDLAMSKLRLGLPP